MKYGSVCSGIEAATVAWHTLGWTPSWFSEIEPFPCSVLAHHYPHVPNLGDMTKIKNRVLTQRVEAPDLLVGGTPCQAFSIAGLRNSLDDQRGQLILEFVRLMRTGSSNCYPRHDRYCEEGKRLHDLYNTVSTKPDVSTEPLEQLTPVIPIRRKKR